MLEGECNSMGYVEKNLITGETVSYKARLHWLLFIKPALIAIVILTMAGLIFYAADLWQKLSEQTSVLIWIGVVVIAGIPILSALLTWRSAEFAVTNKRVILKTGFVQSKTAEMFLNKIESVGVNQSIMGRVLGYGTVEIRGTGGSLEPFHHVSHPLRFRNEIQEQIGKPLDTLQRSTSPG
jgi:uncharacterized membrane protein YdbT with pleckstrin-like domain